MGYDQYTVPDTVAVEPTFAAFLSAPANTRLWPLGPFFQISLKNLSERKNIHNTLSGLPSALFPTTFLEIAVYKR